MDAGSGCIYYACMDSLPFQCSIMGASGKILYQPARPLCRSQGFYGHSHAYALTYVCALVDVGSCCILHVHGFLAFSVIL